MKHVVTHGRIARPYAATPAAYDTHLRRRRDRRPQVVQCCVASNGRVCLTNNTYKTFCFSGNHGVRSVRKKATESNGGTFGVRCHDLEFRKSSTENVYSQHRRVTLSIRRSHPVEFCSASQQQQEGNIFSVNCVSCTSLARSSKLWTLSGTCFKLLISEKIPRDISPVLSLVDISLSTENWFVRNFFWNKSCVHWPIEVNGTSASPLLQDSTTRITETFEHKMTRFFESPNHFSSDPGPRNVQCPG